MVIILKTKINLFRNEYFFLSNFYEADVKYNGIIFPHNEAAFQAQKSSDEKIQRIFTKLSPTQAKRLGKNIYMRRDWNDIKDNIMYEICYNKFSQNELLKEKLINTGDALLIEGNTWHDTYWGMCNNKGQNKLGKILMRVREELK